MPTYPPGYKPTTRRQRADFDSTLSISAAVAQLQDEVRRVKGTALRIDTDLRTRKDGLPISDQRQPDDVGAVVYFTLPGGKKVAMPCDRWMRVEHNLRAIAKTIEAKRGIERWGAATQDAEYEGYLLLGDGNPATPPAAAVQLAVPDEPHMVLGVAPDAPTAVVEGAWRALAKTAHPDRGGSDAAMQRITNARDAMLAARGPTA